MTDATTAHEAAAPAFNLLDEPWLPVRWRHGGSTEVGLRELFTRSGEIVGLAEPSPPSFIALHRLLLAITHRALTLQLGRWTDSDRARWYREGLPLQAFERYFDLWRERFWLFHPTQPFMQVAELATLPQTQPAKPWTVVSLESAGGNNPVVFDHSVDARPSTVPAAHVLRAMLGMLQFTAAGPVKVLRSKPGENGHGRMGALCDSAAVLPTGSNLARTMALSLHPAPRSDDERNADLPSWERPPMVAADLTPLCTLAAGPNDRYTRQVRGLLMVRQAAASLVSNLHFCEGLDLLGDALSVDPMHAFRETKQLPVRLRFSGSKALWRDLPALLPRSAGSGWRPAAILSWALSALSAAGEFDDDVEVTVAGVAAEAGRDKLLATRIERFQLPAGLMSAADAGAAMREQLQRAEDLHDALKQLATLMITRALPNPKSKDTRNAASKMLEVSAFGSTFFARAERGLAGLLHQLGALNLAGAHSYWSLTLLDAANLAWTATGELLGPSAAALRARALTEGAFHALVRPLRPPKPDAPSTEPLQATEEESP